MRIIVSLTITVLEEYEVDFISIEVDDTVSIEEAAPATNLVAKQNARNKRSGKYSINLRKDTKK